VGAAAPAAAAHPARDAELVALPEAPGGAVQAYFFAGQGPHRAGGLTTDARAVATRGSDVLLSGSTYLKDLNGTLFASSVPAEASGRRIGDGWRELHIRLDAPARLRFRVSGTLQNFLVRVDGKKARPEVDRATRMALLRIPAGEHASRLLP
jgi:hypothetical protein